VLTTITEFATIVGPPLVGIPISWVGPMWVIAIDAVTFADSLSLPAFTLAGLIWASQLGRHPTVR
jgi:hypothetical protein